MPNQVIVNGTGSPQYEMKVNSDGSIDTNTTIGSITVTIYPAQSFHDYQSVATVPANVLTTVLTHNHAIAGSPIYLDGLNATGTSNAEWFLYVAGSVAMVQRTTTTDANLQVPLNNYKVNSGTSVQLKVKHYRPNTQDFDATLRYEW